MINKIVRKSMNKKKGMLVAIIILLTISSLFVGISHFVYDTMADNYAQLKIDSNVEDFRLYALPLDDYYDNVYSEEFITSFENKFAVQLELEEQASYNPGDKEQARYTIVKYNPNDEINKIVLNEGEMPTADDEVLLLPQAMEYFNLQIGDTLVIAGNDYKISGNGYIVEYIVPADYANNVLYPNFDKFMPVIMSSQAFDNLDRSEETLTFTKLYKGKFFKYKNKISKRMNIYERMLTYKNLNIPILDDEGKPQITKTGQLVTKPLNRFFFALDREYNPTISSVEDEIQGSQTVFTFLAKLLSVITVFLAVILINSVFKSQRREMGIMKAEGISIPKLSLGFTLYILIILIIGSLIGSVISVFGASAFRNVYDGIFMLKDYDITTNVIYAVASDIIKLIILMLIAIYFISIRKNLRKPTLSLIKNINSEKLPKRNTSKLFKKFSFTRKYQFNLLIRNLSKTILLSFAVIVSSFLILIGVLMYDSVHNMMSNLYTDTFKFDHIVMYSGNNVKNEDQVTNGMINQTMQLASVSTESQLDQKLTGQETVQFGAYDFDTSTTVNLHDLDGNKLTNKYDGVIASTGFMQKYDLQIGDTFTVINPYKADEAKVKLEIVAATEDVVFPFVYMPLPLYQQIFDIRDDMINGYQADKPLTTAEEKEILTDDPAAFIYEAADMEEMMGDSMQILNVVIIIIALLASIIAFVALYTISSVIIESNSKTISVMKVLGYTNKEIKIMTIGIYKWLVIIIYLLSIPLLQTSIQSAVNNAMKDMGFTIPIHLNLVLSLSGLIVIYLVYILASSLTYRKIEKIKLAESLKADE